MITEDLKKIAYREGYTEHMHGFSITDNPYSGVSEILSKAWWDGWWDGFYDE